MTPVRLVDHHVHTTFSDGLGTPLEIAARAAEIGLAGVATVDHLAIGPYDDEPGYSIEIARIDEYIAAVRAAGEAHPGVRVLVAIEVDYGPDTIDEAAALLAAHDFDFVYGSVHFIDGRVVDTRASLQGSLWVDVDAVYERYFEVVAEAVATGLFDVIAHLDLPKKFGHRPRDPEAVGGGGGGGARRDRRRRRRHRAEHLRLARAGRRGVPVAGDPRPGRRPRHPARPGLRRPPRR